MQKWLDIITLWAEKNQAKYPFLDKSIQRHHPLGRSARAKKLNIGLIYVIPLAKKYHDVHSNNPLNITHFRHRFEEEFGTEKEIFYKMCVSIQHLPFSKEVFSAILNHNKQGLDFNIDFFNPDFKETLDQHQLETLHYINYKDISLLDFA